MIKGEPQFKRVLLLSEVSEQEIYRPDCSWNSEMKFLEALERFQRVLERFIDSLEQSDQNSKEKESFFEEKNKSPKKMEMNPIEFIQKGPDSKEFEGRIGCDDSIKRSPGKKEQKALLIQALCSPEYPMPYLRRESPYEVHSSYQSHLVDFYSEERSCQYPSSKNELISEKSKISKENLTNFLKEMGNSLCSLYLLLISVTFKSTNDPCVHLSIYSSFWRQFANSIIHLDFDLEWRGVIPWRIMTECWRARVWEVVSVDLKKDFKTLMTKLFEAKSTMVISELERNKPKPIEASEIPLVSRYLSLWDLEYKEDSSFLEFCTRNNEAGVKVTEFFVTSLMELGLDQWNCKRIGSSSRSIDFGAPFQEVEAIWLESSDQFFEKLFHVFSKREHLDQLPALVMSESPFSSKVFPKMSHFHFLKKTHDQLFDFLKRNFEFSMDFSDEMEFLQLKETSTTQKGEKKQNDSSIAQTSHAEAENNKAKAKAIEQLSSVQIPLVYSLTAFILNLFVNKTGLKLP